jgi:hypothetical protein
MEALSNGTSEPLRRRQLTRRGTWRSFKRRLLARDWRQVPISLARMLLRPFPDSLYLRLGYRAYFGEWPDYRNPKTFNEHVQEYMLRCRDPLLRIPADKIESRAYVAKHVGAGVLVPLIGVWDRAEDVPLSALPRPFVLKPTAASGLVHIVRTGDSVDEDELRATMRRWIRRDYSKLHREWAYQGLPRRLMAEVLLTDSKGGLPPDYKAYVIGGKVRFIQVDRGRFGHHTRNVYDAQWEPLPARWTLEKHSPDPRPDCLDRMVSIAETLAAPFEFLRVDYYLVDGQLYIGELTNYPGAGFEKFIPANYSLHIGAFWPRPGTQAADTGSGKTQQT